MKNIFKLLVVLVAFAACTSHKNSVGETISAADYYAKLQNTKTKQIIDVRTPTEMETGYIDGAILVDYNDENFGKEVDKLNKNIPTFIYCKAGGRSAEALQVLKNKGFKTVYNLEGGLMSWKNNNLPIATKQANSSNNTIAEKAENSIGTSNLTMADFNKIAASNKIVIIDFYAPWCGPCKRLSPMLEELEKEYGSKIKVVKINVDDNADLSNQFRIESIPLVFFYRNGKMANQIMGLPQKHELKMAIETLLD